MLKVESINQSLRKPEGITAIRAEGAYLILIYGGFHEDVEVYLNDQGREVLTVTRPHVIQFALPSAPGFWSRLWKQITRS